MVNEDAALLNRPVTQVTPPHFSTAVYIFLAVDEFLLAKGDGGEFPIAVRGDEAGDALAGHFAPFVIGSEIPGSGAIHLVSPDEHAILRIFLDTACGVEIEDKILVWNFAGQNGSDDGEIEKGELIGNCFFDAARFMCVLEKSTAKGFGCPACSSRNLDRLE